MEGLDNDLLDRIADDPVFRVTREELEEDLQPEKYVGRAPEQVDRFLEEWVTPVLARHGNEIEQPTPDLHV